MATNGKDIIGISKAGAIELKTAVNEYRKFLDERFNMWIETTGYRAISGETSNANFKQMIELFKSDNAKYTNYLMQFENKLNDIINHYAAQDASNGSFTSTANSTLNNQ